MDKILVDSIINKLKNCTGKVGFYYKNLITKEELAYQENESFIAASIIKLPIFAQVIKVSYGGQKNLGLPLTGAAQSVYHTRKEFL